MYQAFSSMAHRSLVNTLTFIQCLLHLNLINSINELEQRNVPWNNSFCWIMLWSYSQPGGDKPKITLWWTISINMIMEIGLGDSLQGLRRQAEACVTLIHLHALFLLLQPPASLYCTIFSVTLTTPYCKALASLMIYLHQGMLVLKWPHKPTVSCIVFQLNYRFYTLFPVVAQRGVDQSLMALL